MKKINNLTATNERLKLNGRNKKRKGGHGTTGNDFKSKFYPTGYSWMHGYKVVRGHTSTTCIIRNDSYT